MNCDRLLSYSNLLRPRSLCASLKKMSLVVLFATVLAKQYVVDESIWTDYHHLAMPLTMTVGDPLARKRLPAGATQVIYPSLGMRPSSGRKTNHTGR